MVEAMHVLVIEDDVRMAAAIRRALHGAGIAADVTASGEDGQWMAGAAAYDAVVLDLMLPDIDGFETCRRLRQADVWVPIIMVTARDAVEDRVRGLDAGADDYLTKPFSLEELLARLRALVRRGPAYNGTVVRVGSLRLDPATRQVWRGDAEIMLSAKEFALLDAFMRRPGQVLGYRQLLDAAWDFGYEHRSNVVEVYVRYLREKIDRPFRVKSLETVRGVGYRLRRDGGAETAGS
jgi:two-component system, OmpR family, response regulator